jgi:hypothetical protein
MLAFRLFRMLLAMLRLHREHPAGPLPDDNPRKGSDAFGSRFPNSLSSLAVETLQDPGHVNLWL